MKNAADLQRNFFNANVEKLEKNQNKMMILQQKNVANLFSFRKYF